MKPDRLTHSYTLTAGESNAEGYMPLTLLVERIIEVATEHANALGIGYATLIRQNIGWVLSRLSVEMNSMPEINENYALTTWIESYNRRFSERNFVITGDGGKVFGYARTVWVAMDFATRTVADLTTLERESFPTAELPCPMAKTPRIGALPTDAVSSKYTFKYCDLDFNRHVNTVRYVELLMNQWPLEHYDHSFASRFDILFHHECHFGEEIELRRSVSDNLSDCEIINHEGIKAIAARFTWKKL